MCSVGVAHYKNLIPYPQGGHNESRSTIGDDARRQCYSLFFFFEVSMELIINRLFALGVSDPACIVADCVDSGRLPLLMDYMSALDLRLLGVHQHPKVEGQAHQVCKLNTPPLEDWGRLFYACLIKKICK